ncbi:MAG: flagellar biosynthesis protein FlhB [Firmicutes bacterium]|nr:flagellar biosynthesis protein FlhB [Bacillota bacterium]
MLDRINRYFAPDIKGRRLKLQLFAESGDKTEEPTPHRQREARKRGQVMKSQEVNAAVNLLGMVFLGSLSWLYYLHHIQALLHYFLRDFTVPADFDLAFCAGLLQFSLSRYLLLVAPFLLVALTLGVSANLLQVGFLVSAEVIRPQLDRINPLAGAKRIFSRRALFEMVKSLLKVSVIGAVSYFYLRTRFTVLLQLLGQEGGVFAAVFSEVLLGLAFRVAGVFLFLAVLDYLFQRFEFQKDLRMTRREVLEEHKHMEGDPHLRARMRERQRALARQRNLDRVPEATVVITNPTALAVALRYREKENQAPVVLAKGAAVMARRIKELAGENNIPVIEDPPVARLLFEKVEVGEEIPVDLYQAVAEILALVYRLQAQRRRQRAAKF